MRFATTKPVPAAAKRKLTPRMRRFALEYPVDLNGTRAAMRAGYDPKWASRRAYILLENPVVLALIDQAKMKRVQRTEITADRVLLEIARIAFLDPRQLFDDHGAVKPVQAWDDDQARAVAGFEVEELWGTDADGNRILRGQVKKLKLWPKDKALDQLGRHLQLYGQHDEEGRTVSELLRTVLLELQQQAPRNVTPAVDVTWEPRHPGYLPPPPRPEEQA